MNNIELPWGEGHGQKELVFEKQQAVAQVSVCIAD
jgi:hypothetical protein